MEGTEYFACRLNCSVISCLVYACCWQSMRSHPVQPLAHFPVVTHHAVDLPHDPTANLPEPFGFCQNHELNNPVVQPSPRLYAALSVRCGYPIALHRPVVDKTLLGESTFLQPFFV